MGRPRIKPMSYGQITQQAEKTINILMKPAQIKTNSEASKEQSVSRAFGALMLWQDLTKSYSSASAKDDENRLFNLLVVHDDDTPSN